MRIRPELLRNEVISIANECGNGLLWVERVQLSTHPRLDRKALLERDDRIGEIVRIVAGLREQPATVANWAAITDLAKKLPPEVSEGAEPISMSLLALRDAIEEAEELLLARRAGLEAL